MQDKEVIELEKTLEQIWEIALRFGLDPFPTKFEIVPATVMYEVGSYALPGRYSHWSFGKAYHRMKTMYDFGLSKIYEVVINTNPSYAFLLETNSLLQNKLVIAHVLGHTDFFKNNIWFSKTNRRMIDTASNHTARMSEYEFKYGHKAVETFLDSVLAIEEHIDPNFFIKRNEAKNKKEALQTKEGVYDDIFALDKTETEKPEDELKLILDMFDDEKIADINEKDIVYFIMKNSPALKDWQRDIMAMIHEEMEYFVPQMQTKTINEGWACATGNSLLATENGFVRFDKLYDNYEKIRVASGGENETNWITDFHKEESVPTIKIRTKRGFEIEGALKHRVQLEDGSYICLSDAKIGDKISLAYKTNVWASENPEIEFQPFQKSLSLTNVAELSGVSLSTIIRHNNGQNTLSGNVIERVLSETDYQFGMTGKRLSTRSLLDSPTVLNENLAWFLGCFVGDGNLTKSGICVTTGDDETKEKLIEIFADSFGLKAKVKWDATETNGRWRVVVYSREIWRWLEAVGIDLSDKARTKKIPQMILRSPKKNVSAFLRGYFDADAYAGKEGIKLSSSSRDLIKTVQIILLNYGILSRQREQAKDNWHLEITGISAKMFHDEIGFGLNRKQTALFDCISTNRQFFNKENLSDEIVSIEHDTNDVYDITVDEKHAYVANGFINHNSFFHSRIMRELNLSDSDHLEFADLHSSVVCPHKGSLNPYYIGYSILEDIEKRFGYQKLFEVRELENDVSLLRNYLTEELVEKLDLYVFELVEEDEWTITEKRWERVRDQLVANMTNFGFPYIVVADGNYNDNRELYLKHNYEGTELDEKYARKTLEHIYKLWGRKVHLETTVDDDKKVLRFDGDDHDED